MKHLVFGTAGHVDHGKTLLTKALTGVDTDRLKEEKLRGITIELGFAPMRLSDGTVLSLVDVPGHEKFVKTMMAGASGIDGVLLVTAADDGVMPQTAEHLNIIRLLGVSAGLLIITKCDLASEARISEVEAQLRALTQDSPLEGAPILRVSAATGDGIPALRQAMEALAADLNQRANSQPFRLNIDRTFPVSGFGTVASGTLTEGTLSVGQQLMLYPAEETGTVRSLQNHNKAVPTVQAGMRTALSLTAGVRDGLERGVTLAQPNSMCTTSTLDVFLQITPDCGFPIRNSSRLHLFHGTREVICRLRLLNAEVLHAGDSGYAQLELSEAMSVRYGDRFLLRFFSPVITVGGGQILAGASRRLKRQNAEVLQRLETLHRGDDAARLLRHTEDSGLIPVDPMRLGRLMNLSPAETEAVIAALNDRLVTLPGGILSRRLWDEAWTALADTLDSWHREYSLLPGMPLSQLRQKLPAEAADVLLSDYVREGRLVLQEGYAALSGFTPVFTREHQIMRRKLLHFYREAWFLAPDKKDVDAKFESRGPIYPQLLNYLRMNGELVSLTPRYLVHKDAYDAALSLFRGLFAEKSNVTLADFRTAAGISRKYAQLFLEYWDRQHLCRREGDGRVLWERP